MTIAYDNLSPDTSSTGNVASLTSGSWTMGSGSNRLLLGFIGTGAGSVASHTGMKWGGSGGTALTIVGSRLNIGSFWQLSAWRLIAPASGSSTLYGNWAGAQDESAIGGVSYSGCDQSTPVGTAVTATGSSTAAQATVTTVAGDVVIAAVWTGATSAFNPTFTPVGPSATARYDIAGSQLGFEGMCLVEAVATGTSTTVGATISTSATWGVIAFLVKAASAGGPANNPAAALLLGF